MRVIAGQDKSLRKVVGSVLRANQFKIEETSGILGPSDMPKREMSGQCNKPVGDTNWSPVAVWRDSKRKWKFRVYMSVGRKGDL